MTKPLFTIEDLALTSEMVKCKIRMLPCAWTITLAEDGILFTPVSHPRAVYNRVLALFARFLWSIHDALLTPRKRVWKEIQT